MPRKWLVVYKIPKIKKEQINQIFLSASTRWIFKFLAHLKANLDLFDKGNLGGH